MSKMARSPAELRNMFGVNLRVLSRQYRSVSDLSRRLNINRTQFNRYLSGESFPRPDVLDRICTFFNVDARVLLEPVDSVSPTGSVLHGPVIADFGGKGVIDIPQDELPDGFYRFSRRSFTDPVRFLVGLVYIFRQAGHTYVRGYEARDAMRQQGLPIEAREREFRGYVSRHEDGLVLIVSRRQAMTSSFNYLSRVASFRNNFWAGYVSLAVRESAYSMRVTRMVYEHLGDDTSAILDTARISGFKTEDELMPFHRRLLQPDQPFR